MAITTALASRKAVGGACCRVRRARWTALAALLSATCLQAANITWTNDAGGDFLTPGNWDSNSVPGRSDVAIFDRALTPYTVTWSGSVTNQAFKVNRGTVRWNLQGNTYAYSNGINCTVGTASNAADLTITNGTVTYSTSGYRPAAISGSGTVLRVHAANVTLLYAGIGSNTTVIADGTNTMFRSYGYTDKIAGRLIVTNDAYLSATDGTKMYTGGSMLISGPGSGHTHGIALSVFQTNSQVRIANGAIVQHSYVNASGLVPLEGRLTLDGGRLTDIYTTTSLGVTGAVAILEGKGELGFRFVRNSGGQIWPGGSNGAGALLIKGDVTNAIPGSGTIAIELGGTQTNQYDQLAVTNGTGGSGTLFAGGTLRVSLIDGFEPAGGDVFKILRCVSINGSFDAVKLPVSKPWDRAALYTTGELRCPSPGPGTPTGVAASDGIYTNRVLVTWNPAANAAGYQVWRSAVADYDSATIVGATTGTTYDDTTVPVDRTSWYWVQATNLAQISAIGSPDSGWRALMAADQGGRFCGGGFDGYNCMTRSDTTIRAGGTVVISAFNDPSLWDLEAANPGFNGGTPRLSVHSRWRRWRIGAGRCNRAHDDPAGEHRKIVAQCAYLKLRRRPKLHCPQTPWNLGQGQLVLGPCQVRVRGCQRGNVPDELIFLGHGEAVLHHVDQLR